MRLAAPPALSFVVWFLGLAASAVAFRQGREQIGQRRYACACLLLGSAVIGWLSIIGADALQSSASLWGSAVSQSELDPANEPIGRAVGRNPGRVVWVHDPAATDWDGPASGEPCWGPGHIDQAVIDDMMSRAVCWLAGESTDEEAWKGLFRFFNERQGRGEAGYQAGEKIAIKINLTTCNAAGKSNKGVREKTRHLDKAGDTSPQMILALLRQLVYVVGVEQSNIFLGDPVAFFPAQWYDYISQEFPGIHYLDHYAFPGRTPVKRSSIPIYWSTTEANGKLQDHLPVSFAEARYLINFAVLKGHGMAGVTLCAKNHYGSSTRTPTGKEWGEQKNYYNLHDSLPCGDCRPGRDKYRALVDLMGHANLGGKTLLYLIDGLYGGYFWEGTPYKWHMAPFNGDWPSSLFASQDPVAIDSVAYDFLRAEWPSVVEDGNGAPGSLAGGAQDYLHEAALAHDPPSGTFYDPEKDGKAMESLGVHEHWNNAETKAYTGNLGTGSGIELISSKPIPSSRSIKGDLNGDGVIDLVDALLAARLLANDNLKTETHGGSSAGGNEKTGLRDVLQVLQVLSGVR